MTRGALYTGIISPRRARGKDGDKQLTLPTSMRMVMIILTCAAFITGTSEQLTGMQGRRHVIWVGGAGLRERASNIKRAPVNPYKNQKLVGLRPLFWGKGPFSEQK